MLDEVSDLVDIEVHELVDVVHAGATRVGWEASLADHGASEKESKVGVKVSQEDVLGGGGAVGWHVLLERSSPTAVEPVDGRGGSVVVRGDQGAVEVWDEVDSNTVVGAIGVEDTGNGNSDVWCGVVTDDGGVDNQGHCRRGNILEGRSIFEWHG